MMIDSTPPASRTSPRRRTRIIGGVIAVAVLAGVGGLSWVLLHNAKDSGGPYSYDVVKKLMAAAKREGADYAVDVYPRYGSDVEATLRAGYDIRHGLIGAGVYASHGYERSHRDGVKNTLLVLKGYLEV